MRNKLILLISLIIIFTLTGCDNWGEASVEGKQQLIDEHLKNMKYSGEKNQGSILNPDPKYTVMVSRVIDGDTIVFTYNNKDVKGRLLCIDAPEDTHKKQAWGHEATLYLRKLIEGKMIEIEFDNDERDKYGRYLIHVTYNGQSVQQLLLQQGLARIAYIYDQYKYIDDYKAAEKEAKRTKKNIWSVQGYSTPSGYNMSVIKKKKVS